MVEVEAWERGEADLDADFFAWEDEDGVLPAGVVDAVAEGVGAAAGAGDDAELGAMDVHGMGHSHAHGVFLVFEFPEVGGACGDGFGVGDGLHVEDLAVDHPCHLHEVERDGAERGGGVGFEGIGGERVGERETGAFGVGDVEGGDGEGSALRGGGGIGHHADHADVIGGEFEAEEFEL